MCACVCVYMRACVCACVCASFLPFDLSLVELSVQVPSTIASLTKLPSFKINFLNHIHVCDCTILFMHACLHVCMFQTSHSSN